MKCTSQTSGTYILQMMYPKPTYGIKYVNKKVDYDIVEKTKAKEKKKIEDLYLGTKEIEKEYDKVKIKVTYPTAA